MVGALPRHLKPTANLTPTTDADRIRTNSGTCGPYSTKSRRCRTDSGRQGQYAQNSDAFRLGTLPDQQSKSKGAKLRRADGQLDAAIEASPMCKDSVAQTLPAVHSLLSTSPAPTHPPAHPSPCKRNFITPPEWVDPTAHLTDHRSCSKLCNRYNIMFIQAMVAMLNMARLLTCRSLG